MTDENKHLNELKRLAFFNRQPTLHRHGIPTMKIVPMETDEEKCIGVSPLSIEPMNMDFDGDTAALYICHDIEALEEMYQKSYLKSHQHYDANDSFLATIRHEALFAAYVLTSNLKPIEKDPFTIISLESLPEDVDWYNDRLFDPIKIDDYIYTYGLCLLNKWCGFGKVKINKVIGKGDVNLISETIYSNNPKGFYDQLTELENRLFMFITISKHTPSLNVHEMIDLVDDKTNILFKKLPDNNPILGYHINLALIDRCLEKFNKESTLYKLFKSGSRFNKQQLSRSCINVGYSANAENIVVSKPIKTSLLEGLTEEDFFLGSPGSRKGASDKAKETPRSGYLERTAVMMLAAMELSEDDCGTDNHLEIVVFSKKHAQTLVGKYYRPEHDTGDWAVLTYPVAESFINKKIQIRSPMTCITPNFRMCKKCFGEKETPTKYLGITAGQVVTERITQLILRVFHTSGSADLDTFKTVVEFFKNHLEDIIYLDEKNILVFNTINIPIEVQKMAGFESIDHNQATFNKYDITIKNKDVNATLKDINLLLKTNKKNVKTPAAYYMEMMRLVIEVGTIYSSFIEMIFANMLLADVEKKLFWRYNQHLKVVFKLGDKTLASMISPLLGLLYQPNKKTIELLNIDTNNTESYTIYERLWLAQL